MTITRLLTLRRLLLSLLAVVDAELRERGALRESAHVAQSCYTEHVTK